MNVYICEFNKRLNSTKVPDALVLGNPYSCKLKSPCSILQPTIILELNVVQQAALQAKNYAYIPQWSRYYRITNWNFNGVLVEASLKVDTLATYKTDITASYQYILRAASDYDGYIKDTKYPIKATSPTIVCDNDNGIGLFRENPLQPPTIAGQQLTGCFVIGVISNDASITGCVSYYVLSDAQLAEYMGQLFTLSTQWGSSGQDLADGLKKAITDPMQYVVSCIWLPYIVPDFTSRGLVTQVSSIKTGYDNVPVTQYAYRFTAGINVQFTNVIRCATPSHPLAASRGYYMNREPYTRYYLSFYPFCPLIELDGMRLDTNIYLVYTVDLRTGKGVLNVCSRVFGTDYTNWKPAAIQRSIEAQVGVQIPLAAIRTEMPSSFSEYVTNVATASINSEFGGFKQAAEKTVNSAANWVMGGIAKLFGSEDLQQAVQQSEETHNTWSSEDLSNVASSALAMKSTVEAVGSQGTLSMYSRMPLALWAECYNPASDSLADYGRPLCRRDTLANFSGFVMCDHPHVAGTGAFPSENSEIESFLTTGLFIE